MKTATCAWNGPTGSSCTRINTAWWKSLKRRKALSYTWDWDEKKLKGKKVGINVRKRLYTFNDKDRETTEIGRFETVDDVRNGKCKPMKERDQRTKREEDSTDGSEFTDVSSDVSVPWA